MSRTFPFSHFRLDLTESSWIIHADDATAVPVVEALGRTMALPSCRPDEKVPPGSPGKYLRVVTGDKPSILVQGSSDHPSVTCTIPAPVSSDLLFFGMTFAAQAIIRVEKSRGGLLVHGALAQSPGPKGGGIILAGPGQVGKTTASGRLPQPWQSLSDDASLVLRDSSGQYWVHPWPTWSRFLPCPDEASGPGGQWNVRQRLPLKAVFFLGQSEEIRITPLPPAPALAYLMGAVQQLSQPGSQRLPAGQVRFLEERQLAAAEKLVRAIPTYTLHLNLTGAFWKDIEQTLTADQRISSGKKTNTAEQPLYEEGVVKVSYSGPSMTPTLRHHDLLEVLPYRENPVRAGDIICYPSPADGVKVIHRVIRITADGIRTRGDNNAADDPYTIDRQQIVGRVTAVWRNGKRRRIAGGKPGIIQGFSAFLYHRIRAVTSKLLHGSYRTLSSRGLIRSFAPSAFRPRVYAFRQRNQPPILKLMVNGHAVGRFDALLELWVIDFPWRLVVNESRLPGAAGPHSTDDPALADTGSEKET